MVAAAVIGGVIAAAGAVGGAAISADATRSSTNKAIAAQQSALAQQATLSQPYRDLGSAAIPTYQNLLTGDPATQQKTLESLPGYQFTKNQGIEAAKRASPNLSGNQTIAAEQYGAGLADQTYAERLNQLLEPIQIGQAAAAGQAANIGTAAGNISGALINQGNTTAGIDANLIAGLTRAGAGTINNVATLNTLAGLNRPGANVQVYGGGDPGALDTTGAGVNPWTGANVPPTYDPGLGPG